MSKIIAKDEKEQFILYDAEGATPEDTAHMFMLSYGLYEVPREVSGSLIDKCFVETPSGLRKLAKYLANKE